MTTGLDVENRKKTMNYLKQYHQDFDSTLIFITHYFEEIEGLIDRVIIMYEGKIIEDDTIAALFKKYNMNNYVQVYLSEENKQKFIEKISNFPYEDVGENTIIIYYKDEAEITKLINTVHRNNDLYEKYSLGNPKMNDLYYKIFKERISE